MIRADFGTVEVEGLKPVVMAEFLSLLKCLRNILGEADYNRVLQDANDAKKFCNEPEEKKPEFVPHLVSEGRIFGCIGSKTNICDITGRELSTGDVVNLYVIEDNGKLDFRGEHPIAKDNDAEYVMGIKGTSFDNGVSLDADWVIVLNRRHTEVEDGEIVGGIKYIKSEGAGK